MSFLEAADAPIPKGWHRESGYDFCGTCAQPTRMRNPSGAWQHVACAVSAPHRPKKAKEGAAVKDEAKHMMQAGVISNAMQELRDYREGAAKHMDRIVSEARKRIETLEEIGARDVFEEARILAVGQAYLEHGVTPGSSVHMNAGNLVVMMNVVKSDRDATAVMLANSESSKKDPQSGGRELYRAMLVIWSEDRTRPGIKK